MTQFLAIKDDDGHPLVLPPQEVMSIVADTEITWRGVTPATDVNIYFVGGSELTYSVEAGITIPVHKNLRLSSTTTCLVY